MQPTGTAWAAYYDVGGKMDKDGYPEDHELNTIANWDIRHKYVEDLFNYISKLWLYSDISAYWQVTKGKNKIKYEISTGGWSGNEDIIKSLQKNIVWHLYLQESRRGGHYVIIIPNKATALDSDNQPNQ